MDGEAEARAGTIRSLSGPSIIFTGVGQATALCASDLLVLTRETHNLSVIAGHLSPSRTIAAQAPQAKRYGACPRCVPTPWQMEDMSQRPFRYQLALCAPVIRIVLFFLWSAVDYYLGHDEERTASVGVFSFLFGVTRHDGLQDWIYGVHAPYNKHHYHGGIVFSWADCQSWM